MNRTTIRHARSLRLLAIAAAIATLAGCGGGGDSSGTSTTTQQPADQTLNGVVIDGPIKGATVCLDLNNNGRCDAGEPTSTATNAQGAYTITGLTADQVASGAPLIAVIPSTAVDANNPTGTVGTGYTLSAPGGKGAVISPITTWVQSGVAQGMTRAASEAAIASQLQVAATSLYNDYTASTAGDNATLARIVPTMVVSLQAGEQLSVSAPATTNPGYTVRYFMFTNAGNYDLRYYYSNNVPDANGLTTFYDRHQVMSGGAPGVYVFDTALFATSRGWAAESSTAPNTTTGGSPSVSTWNSGEVYVSTRVDTDVSGQSIASVVAMAQDLSVNTTSTLVGVNAASLSGVFPTGSKILRYRTMETSSPVAYRVSDGYVGSGVTTLAGLVAAYPVPTTPTGANTVSAGNLHGEGGCLAAFCPQERLRAAFGPANSVSYYLCDLTTATNVSTNCNAIGTGTYSLGTAADGSSPIMPLAGVPAAAASIQTFTRVFVQRNGVVYYGWQYKLTSTVQTRLNKTAFEALATALGITPPAIDAAPSAYAGTWSASYSGSDNGSCAAIVIDTTGAVTGNCVSTGVGGSFAVSGSVASTGVASFMTTGGTTSGAAFNGNFTGATGSGTWTWPSRNGSGTWSATKH